MTLLSVLVISIGYLILCLRNNLVAFLIALEIILLGASLNVLLSTQITGFGSSTGYYGLPGFYVIAINLALLIVAAVETAIGLSLIVALERLTGSIEIPFGGIKG